MPWLQCRDCGSSQYQDVPYMVSTTPCSMCGKLIVIFNDIPQIPLTTVYGQDRPFVAASNMNWGPPQPTYQGQAQQWPYGYQAPPVQNPYAQYPAPSAYAQQPYAQYPAPPAYAQQPYGQQPAPAPQEAVPLAPIQQAPVQQAPVPQPPSQARSINKLALGRYRVQKTKSQLNRARQKRAAERRKQEAAAADEYAQNNTNHEQVDEYQPSNNPGGFERGVKTDSDRAANVSHVSGLDIDIIDECIELRQLKRAQAENAGRGRLTGAHLQPNRRGGSAGTPGNAEARQRRQQQQCSVIPFSPLVTEVQQRRQQQQCSVIPSTPRVTADERVRLTAGQERGRLARDSAIMLKPLMAADQPTSVLANERASTTVGSATEHLAEVPVSVPKPISTEAQLRREDRPRVTVTEPYGIAMPRRQEPIPVTLSVAEQAFARRYEEADQSLQRVATDLEMLASDVAAFKSSTARGRPPT